MCRGKEKLLREISSATTLSTPARCLHWVCTRVVRSSSEYTATRHCPCGELAVARFSHDLDTELSVSPSHTGMWGEPSGKYSDGRPGVRSATRVRTAANCKITTRNSRELMWTKPGVEAQENLRPARTCGLHPTSNQKHKWGQYAPPPTWLASPQDQKCGRRGIIMPSGVSQGFFISWT